MLNKTKHDLVLRQILKDVFLHSDLRTKLGFKGGTALYIFYNLPRFSTDLDFDLTDKDKFNPGLITQIMSKYVTVQDVKEKRYTWFWLGSYGKGEQKVKLEVSKHRFKSQYQLLDFLGIPVRVMSPSYMLAHKLCAISDRPKLQSRDLFDAWFMFSKNWQPEAKVIKQRTGLEVRQYYQELVSLVSKIPSNRILDGLGEVLDSKTKDWVRDHLISELVFQFKLRENLTSQNLTKY